MPIERLLLVGAGGHAKVVYDALLAIKEFVRIEIRDDDPNSAKDGLLGSPVLIPIGDPSGWSAHVHIAIGDNQVRRQLGEAALAAAKKLYTVSHPSALVSQHAEIGAGAFVAAAAIVAPSARVGAGAIVNHGAIVDHDCDVGAWAHIAPNAVLGGDVRVGRGCLIGSSAVLLPGVRVGDWAIVGSGAVVTADVEAKETVVGVPAKSLRRR